jgi:hypothetical protein
MTIRRLGRRVGLAGALVTVVVGAVIGVRALPAVGDVTPTGPVTLTWSTGSFTLTVNGTPQTLQGFTGSATGTVSAAGVLNFPASGVTLNPISTTIVIPVTLASEATSAWTGTIDPANGTATLTGQLRTLVTSPGLLDNCPVGPFTIQLSTTNPGGVPYNEATGAATLTDSTFVLLAIPDGAPGCGGIEAAINGALGLPATGAISFSVGFEPIITGAGAPPPPTTIPTIPTTVATTPLSAQAVPVPPVTATAAQGQLARTGAGSLPIALGAGVLVFVGIVAVLPRDARRGRQPRD